MALPVEAGDTQACLGGLGKVKERWRRDGKVGRSHRQSGYSGGCWDEREGGGSSDAHVHSGCTQPAFPQDTEQAAKGPVIAAWWTKCVSLVVTP